MSNNRDASPVDLAHEADFRVGHIKVSPSTREVVMADGSSEILEPRIMQVLVALARHRGRILSRDDLIRDCWNGRIVGEDALNRCVARVRAAGRGRRRVRARNGAAGRLPPAGNSRCRWHGSPAAATAAPPGACRRPGRPGDRYRPRNCVVAFPSPPPRPKRTPAPQDRRRAVRCPGLAGGSARLRRRRVRTDPERARRQPGAVRLAFRQCRAARAGPRRGGGQARRAVHRGRDGHAWRCRPACDGASRSRRGRM